MKGVLFYEEFKNKRNGVSEGTVIAAFVCNGTYQSEGEICYEGLVGVYPYSNSPVASSSIGLWYLRKHCKRISEAKAREIHPRMFERLDMEEQTP